MTFLQMLIALAMERLMPHWMQYRVYHFIDDFFARMARLIPARTGWQAYLLVASSVAVPVLFVAIVQDWVGEILFGEFLLGLVFLFYCLGPKDLAEQLKALVAAMQSRDEDAARSLSDDFVDWDEEDSMTDRTSRMLASIAFLSLERLFGVLFWFALLGPAGGVLFRVSQLISRHYRIEGGPATEAAELLYFSLSWLPSRLVALGYGLSGHFTRSMETWMEKADQEVTYGADEVRNFLAKAGIAALDTPMRIIEEWDEAVLQLQNIMGLIWRTLVMWLAVIALLTIGSWLN